MILDFHTHIWRFEDEGVANTHLQSSAEELIRAMDRACVDKAVTVPIAYVPSGQRPKRVLLDNEYMLASMRMYPERLIGFVEIDPREEPSAYILRHFLGRGLGGLKLLPRRHAYIMSDHTLLDPLLTICAEHRVPVFVLAFDDIWSTPLQIEEMARAFPEIPAFVIGQMGRKWLMDEAFMVAARTANVFLETSDTNVDDLSAAFQAVGARKILYASHWHPDVMQEHISMHRSAIPDQIDQALVLGENARRIFDSRRESSSYQERGDGESNKQAFFEH